MADRVADVRLLASSMTALPRQFALAVGMLAVLFARPLFDLARFALKSDTFSHILLIPFVAGYLASLRWKAVMQNVRGAPSLGLVPLAAGGLLLAINLVFVRAPETRLCLFALSFVSLVFAAAFCFLGASVVRQLAFPLALLLFIVPFPPPVMDAVEFFFQHASAMAAGLMMRVSGLPAMQDGLLFFLPGFAIEVAQECSGIRSTLVLFITSLVAGYLLLRQPRDRAILALSIVPLAILRNGFRIFTLAWLSVEVNPEILHSALHRRGGPIFFALSLIPLFLLLLLLRKLEKKHPHAT